MQIWGSPTSSRSGSVDFNPGLRYSLRVCSFHTEVAYFGMFRSIGIAVWLLAQALSLQAATILEARLKMPFEYSTSDGKERWMVNAAAFFHVDGDSVSYSVWIPKGCSASSELELISTMSGDDIAISLAFSEFIELPTLSPIPANPWLSTPADGFVSFDPDTDVLWPPIGIPAFITYEVYEAALNDPELAAVLLSDGENLLSLPAKLPQAGLVVLGPWAGTIAVVPEISTTTIALGFLGLPLTVRRRR